MLFENVKSENQENESKHSNICSAANLREALTVSNMRLQESTEQLSILTESIEILCQLASMDTKLYTTTLVQKPMLGTLDTTGSNSNSSFLQYKLDQIQKEWKLEDTAVPKLLQFVYRFHSINKQIDAYSEREQAQNFKDQCKVYQDRNNQLERALVKLHKKNESLGKRLKESKRERKSMIKAFKNHIRQTKQDTTEQLSEQQLKFHEQIMKLEACTPMKDVAVGNRSRGYSHGEDSHDSSLSDFGIHDILMLNQHKEQNFETNHNESSTTMSSSTQSLVVDEGVATVHFQAASGENDAAEHIVCSFASNSPIGLQFCRFALDAVAAERRAFEKVATNQSDKPFFFNLDALLKKQESRTSFVVCGAHGFDGARGDAPPPIGSILTAIDGKSIEDQTLTIAQINEMTANHPFRLTFRVVRLTKKERDLLDGVVKNEATQRANRQAA